jgi:DNA-binding response OmpR family regulator
VDSVPARKHVTRKRFIVIHEENDLIRELIERWLREGGYFVVDRPKKPLDALGSHRPRLVIANMPSPSAAQPLIDMLRALYAAPILALSGRFRRGLAGSAEAARRLGVKKVLPKPFTRKELLLAVHEALRGGE